jgi:DNA polymerase elongation subunit (family B)
LWDTQDWLGLELYNMNDVQIMYDLYHKLKGVREVMSIEATKVQLGYLKPNKRYVSAFVDNVFTRIAFSHKMAVPQMNRWKRRDDETVVTIGAGGFVPEPKEGLHFNIVSIDYFSLYPSIYITHNIGINTVDWNNEFEDSIKTEELSYRPTPKGLNAEFMEYLLETRREYRLERKKYQKGTPEYDDFNIKQSAFKDILVSANGVLEQKNFRYKSQPIYNSAVKTGQFYLQYLIEAAELLGWELVEADTDGGHFITPYETIEGIVENLKEAEAFIKNYVKEKAMARWNIPEEHYKMLPRCEAISSHFYCISRKSYIRRIVWDDGMFLEEPRFDAKGMPGVKYNTLPLLKEILKNVFKKVVFTVDRDTDYVALAVDYLLRIKDDLFSGRRDDWLTFAQRVDKLEGRLPHNRAAAILASRGLFEPGMIIKFIRRANGDIILPDYEKDFKVDFKTYSYYWAGTVAKWMQDLLPEVVGNKELGFKMAAPTKELVW